MDIRKLTASHSVSPQIGPDDVPAIAEAGFSTLICNRPDHEVLPEVQMAVLRDAAEAAGLEFFENPVEGGAISLQNVELQKDILGGEGRRVLAYCASGTRSTVMWALASAGTAPTEVLIDTAARAGYRIDGLRSQIDALADADS